MREVEAIRLARQLDLKAKAGTWYKARKTIDDWVVVRVCGDKERVYRRAPRAASPTTTNQMRESG